MSPANEWKTRAAKWFDPLTNQWRAGVLFSNVIDGFPDQEVGAVISNEAVAERMVEALAGLPALTEALLDNGYFGENGAWHTDGCHEYGTGDKCPPGCVQARAALKAAGVEVGG